MYLFNFERNRIEAIDLHKVKNLDKNQVIIDHQASILRLCKAYLGVYYGVVDLYQEVLIKLCRSYAFKMKKYDLEIQPLMDELKNMLKSIK